VEEAHFLGGTLHYYSFHKMISAKMVFVRLVGEGQSITLGNRGSQVPEAIRACYK